ncbi:hypothetical protein [Desulfurobacterium sp.]
MKRALLIVCLLLLSSFSTCGRRGNPLPPRDFHPLPPSKIFYQQTVLTPVIFWNPPEKFEDGEKISTREKRKLTYIVDIDFGKEQFKTKQTLFKYKAVQPGKKICFRVAALYEKLQGEFSEPICKIIKKPIKSLPAIKDVKIGDRMVRILFDNPFHKTIEIFKSEFPAEFNYLKPFSTVTNSTFADTKVENGKTYYYRARYAENEIKGPFSKIIKATPEDNVPPAPPEHPILITNHLCYLVWEPSESSDVKYYKIFYNGKCIGKTTRLTYFLTTCGNGTYQIGAVDKAGNITLSKPAARR